MSSKDILTPDEVDALVSSDDQGRSLGGQEGNVRLLDFMNQERIVRSQFPALERIHERFVRKFETSIYDLMTNEFEATLGDIKVVSYSDLMSSVNNPSCINVVRFHPLRGKALVIFNTELVYGFVDNYFGGDGKFGSVIEDREFTQTESHIIELVFNALLGDLQTAWAPIMKINIEKISDEMNPQMVNASSPDEMILVTEFNVCYEKLGGRLMIAMPYSMLEPMREALDLGAGRSDDEVDPNWLHSLREEVLDAPLEVGAKLCETNIPFSQLVSIKAGDVIPIELPEQVTLRVANLPTFRAKFGVSRDKCALKILSKIQR
jgi:flagellar motor switch protein FliM